MFSSPGSGREPAPSRLTKSVISNSLFRQRVRVDLNHGPSDWKSGDSVLQFSVVQGQMAVSPQCGRIWLLADISRPLRRLPQVCCTCVALAAYPEAPGTCRNSTAATDGDIEAEIEARHCLHAGSRELSPYALQALVNHKQPPRRGDVTGGYITLSTERLRGPARQVEDTLLKLAGAATGAKIVGFPARRGAKAAR